MAELLHRVKPNVECLISQGIAGINPVNLLAGKAGLPLKIDVGDTARLPLGSLWIIHIMPLTINNLFTTTITNN